MMDFRWTWCCSRMQRSQGSAEDLPVWLEITGQGLGEKGNEDALGVQPTG